MHGKTYTELFQKVDEALYYAKAHGKNTFHVLGASKQSKASSQIDSRDIRKVLEHTADGIAKYAYSDALKLLYFNKRLANLVGSDKDTVSEEKFDPYSFVYPEDLPLLKAALQIALPNKTPIDVCFRLLHSNGACVPVRLRGIFVNELYQNRYPVFYAVYTDLSSL